MRADIARASRFVATFISMGLLSKVSVAYAWRLSLLVIILCFIAAALLSRGFGPGRGGLVTRPGHVDGRG
jgi:hypothetical protein